MVSMDMSINNFTNFKSSSLRSLIYCSTFSNTGSMIKASLPFAEAIRYVNVLETLSKSCRNNIDLEYHFIRGSCIYLVVRNLK